MSTMLLLFLLLHLLHLLHLLVLCPFHVNGLQELQEEQHLHLYL